MHTAREITFTNNLFSNAGLWGTWESDEVVGDAGPGYDGERYLSTGGYLSVESYTNVFGEEPDVPTDDERTIIIKNNNFGGLPAQEYLDNWEEFNTYDPENKPILGFGSSPWTTDPEWIAENPDITPDDPAWALRDTILRVRIMESHIDSTLSAWQAEEVAWLSIENNIRENVTIADMPSSMAHYINVLWYGDEDQPEHYDYWEEISADPFTRYYHPAPGDPINTEGPTASWFRNLAYNEDSESYTHAEMGYPAGNLNFFPDLKELWLEGVDLSTTSVQEQTSNATFAVYPNPAKDALHLNQEADEIIIYNILGEQMMKAQNVQTLNVSELSNGIYILSITKDNQISSQKIMVNK